MSVSEVRKIAIVVSQFNRDITEALYSGAVKQLQALGVVMTKNDTAWVPGAVEIPLMAQQYARSGDYHAVIMLGAVIRGETDHYEHVSTQVSNSCQRIALEYNLPVIFGVLTTHTKQQALDRVGGVRGHMGKEAAETAVYMVDLISDRFHKRTMDVIYDQQ